MKQHVNHYMKYKTYRILGDKENLPNHLKCTDLQANHPFIMVSSMNCVFSPDLSEQFFDYSSDEYEATMLQLTDQDLKGYFVPVNVTTVYNGHVFEWRQTNDNIVFHGGVYKMEQRLKSGDLMASERITYNTLLNVYNQFIREYFTKVENNV